MSGVVLDTSAYVLGYTEVSTEAEEVRARIAAEPCQAPHLLSAEAGSVARRLVIGGALSAADGLRLVERVDDVVTRWHPHGALTRTAWLLRDRITFYDALFVALAWSLDLPLLTADAQLARTPLPCAVEVVSSRRAPASATPS